jgi:formiminotetrahydrofolate cyclodeaminase
VTLLGLPAGDLLDRFAAPDPTPGGGSAAALAGATGAALAAMVCAMTRTRGDAEADRPRLDAALGWAKESGARLRALVDEDTRAYDDVVAAYRLPKATDDEKAARRERITQALTRATDVPLATAEACLVVLAAAGEALRHGNPNAESDARTAAALAWAGLLGAAENVKANAGGVGEAGERAMERLVALVAEGRSRFHAAMGPSQPG